MRLITEPDLPTGRYFNGTREARANAQAYDADAREHLRRLSDELITTRTSSNTVQAIRPAATLSSRKHRSQRPTSTSTASSPTTPTSSCTTW